MPGQAGDTSGLPLAANHSQEIPMELKKSILRVANGVFNMVVILLLVISGSFSAFALWDNQRIYSAAGDVRADMIKLKPERTLSEEADTGADFSELLKVNPDVCAWLTLDNTEIDYPILRGETNFTYLNTDVYGNFALAGSIFLDSRSSRDFTDTVSLVYGHHMADRKMFGDLDLYKDADFFRDNRTGLLILPEQTYQLEIIACMLVNASEENIFEPTRWQAGNISAFLNFVSQEALFTHEDGMERLRGAEEPFKLLCLSTCASEFTDARTIVLAVMEPYSDGTHYEN